MLGISVIVPIYNTEEFLVECLESIKKQNYQNFEVILVDDGSTDNSENICKKICNEDSRFRYFKKKNGGSSSARNFGLKYAKGDYVYFIDSDDYIEFNTFEILIDNINKHNADIVIFGRYRDYGHKKIKVFSPKKTRVLDPYTTNIEMLAGKNMDFSSCDKIYKKELWDDIEFPIGIVGEDIATIPKIISKSKKIIQIPNCLYNYRIRSNSITAKTLNTHTFDTEIVLKYFEDIYTNGTFKEKMALNSFKTTQYLFFIQKLLYSNNKEVSRLSRYESFLRKNILLILFNPIIKYKIKIHAFLAVFPMIYKKVILK